MYKVTGVSKFKGTFKVRFANDLTRVKLLTKSGNTDINLIELPKAMSKSHAVNFLKTSELYLVPAQAAAIDEADAKYNPKTVVRTNKAKAPVAKTKVAPTLAAIKARPAKTTKPAKVENTPVAAEAVTDAAA